MRTRLVVLAIGAIALTTAGAAAQEKPAPAGSAASHEFGVDLSMTYTKVGSGCVGSCGVFTVATPVDVRIGFLTSGPMSIEPRFSLSYTGVNGSHALRFTPGVNVLYEVGALAGPGHRMGPYVTAGAALDLVDLGSGGSSSTSSQTSVNVGFGSRVAWGTAAVRPEAFFRYNFENAKDGVASSFDVGVRVGISLFQ